MDEDEIQPVQMSYDEALTLAIFCINTFMHPDASAPEDVDRLEDRSDDVIATLVDIRDAVRGPSDV
jgi:hypothetical protein